MSSYRDLSDLELRDSPFSWEKVEGREMSVKGFLERIAMIV